MKSVYHIHLSAPTFLNKGIGKGFKANGWNEIALDWQKVKTTLGIQRLRAKIVEDVNGLKPDLVFAQIQSKGILDVDTVQEIMKVAPMCLFNIDARDKSEMEWFYDLAKHVTHSFVSNGMDVSEMQVRNIWNCSVLQSSCDGDEYFPVDKKDDVPAIVFVGNKSSKFENSQQRINMVKALQKEFGLHFGVYGLGWGAEGFVSVERERELYSGCKAAICHNNFDYPAYESDRIWRIIFCGASTVHYTSKDSLPDFIAFLKQAINQSKFKLWQPLKDAIKKENTYEMRVKTIEQVLESNYGLKF